MGVFSYCINQKMNTDKNNVIDHTHRASMCMYMCNVVLGHLWFGRFDHGRSHFRNVLLNLCNNSDQT